MTDGLTSTWLERWCAKPDAIALIDGSTATIVSARELDARSEAAALRLAAAGVEPGDRVLLSCKPSVATVVAYVGILRLGQSSSLPTPRTPFPS